MKKTLHFKVLAGVVAMLLVLPTAGFATTVDLGSGGGHNYSGDSGTMYVDATVSTTYNTPIFDTNAIVTVAPFDSTTTYNTPGTGTVGEQVVTPGDNTPSAGGFTVIETLLDEGASVKTIEVDSGGVVINPNGDVTLSGSTTYNSAVYTDTAKVLHVDSDPDSLTYGAVIYNSTATGTWVAGAGLDEGVFEEVTEDPIVGSDGNLDVGGSTLLRGTLEVLGATVTNGISNSDERITDVADAVDPTDAVNLRQMEAADVVLQDNIDAEEAARIAADLTLQGNIDAEETARIAADAAIQADVDQNEADSDAADVVLQGNIDAEEAARIAADISLQADIDQEVADRTALIHQEDDGIHIGADSLVYDEDNLGERDALFTTDGGGIDVLETLTVRPEFEEATTSSSPQTDLQEMELAGDGGINYAVKSQFDVIEESDQELGGSVTMTTDGSVTLAKPTAAGYEIEYFVSSAQAICDTQDCADLYGVAIGQAIDESDVPASGEGSDLVPFSYVATAIDPDTGDLAYLGEIVLEDGILVLDKSDMEDDFYATLVADGVNTENLDGGNLKVEGNADIDGNLELGAIADVEAAINNNTSAVASETSARIEGDLYLDDRIDRVKSKVDDLEDRVDAVGAFSAAFSALVPNDRVAGNTQVSLGLGAYAGETAIAAGLFHYFGDNILVNAGFSHSMDESETAGRAGITYGF